MKAKIRFLLATIMMLAGITNARAQAYISGSQIDVFDASGTLSSDMTCTDFKVREASTLTVNQGVTLTLNCLRFVLYNNSTIELHGTMTGSAGSDVTWTYDSYINVHLSDGAKYSVSGLSCSDFDGDSYLRYYGYDAATDGHGTVSVTDGPTTVTANTIGYKTTSYTFTATPNSGYRFVNWTKGEGGEVLGTAASIAVSCQQNGQYQVYANFEEDVPAGPQMRTLTGVPQGWQVQAGDPLTGVDSNADGSYSIEAGQPVLLVPSAEDKPRVKSVTLTEAVESDPLATPLTMEALSAGTIVVDMSNGSRTMKYSKNGGAKTTINATTTIDVAAGDKVQFYGNGTSTTSYNGTKISGGTASVKVYGNVMSLVDEENFATATTLSSNAFQSLFDENATLTDASELLLPATTLANNCYQYMFYGCSALTTAPELPATTLTGNCYYRMFFNCSHLSSVTCLATDITATNCIANWLRGVAATGTFTTPSSTNWGTGPSGIPSGWTRVDPNAPVPMTLEATTTAWADGSNYAVPAGGLTYSDAVTVSGDVTLTLTEGTTLTLNKGISLAEGATLTVEGTGTMNVYGTNGNGGGSTGTVGWTGGDGGVAISGNIIVQGGATVTATGGNGGNGGYGDFSGGNGGNGGAAISGNIIVQGGATVTATGGKGGNGGNAEEERAGNGGNGGNAFAGTLTYKSGTVTANGGSGGSGGSSVEEGSGSGGSAGKAFANDVDFTQTTGYSVTNGTSTIGSVLNQRMVVISGGTPITTGN